MKTKSKTFNIYCDESCHMENDHKPFMFIGSISAAYNQVKVHTKQINEMKRKHRFYAEIKWSTVSQSKLHFYLELVDYLFASDLKFRGIGVEKSKIKNDAFEQTCDDFYYKMYYQLLRHDIMSTYLYNSPNNYYNVYLDIKDSLSACKVRKLREILNTKYGVFRNIQNIHSHESVEMQLTDFFMGAISYYKNDTGKKNKAKVRLIEEIMKKSGCDFNKTNYSNKFNLFYIKLQ
ncbi:hypothetical protein FACS1894181_05120 [Bacteroidia bacterium]|nr:hypothetical protein FACS1894181_05120 [Bacteroidia bacterium]